MRQSAHSVGLKSWTKKTDMGTQLPRAIPLGHEGMQSDGLRKGFPPNISVLAANGRVLPAGLHIHVIEGRLPYHVVCPCKLYSISRLQGWSTWVDPKPKCHTRPRKPCFLLSSPLVTPGRGLVETPTTTRCPTPGSPVPSPSVQCGSRCSCLLHS